MCLCVANHRFCDFGQPALSVPSDEYKYVRIATPDYVDGLQASSVTKSSLLLADHLMGVLEGKEGSDDAVLEEMDNLRTLLFDLEHKEPPLDLPADSSRTDESTLAGAVEVTLDDFIARDQWHQHTIVIDDTVLPLVEDEWFERMMHDALDYDSDLKADDASREECPDLTDPRQGEDRIRMDLGEISFVAAAAAHQREGESRENVDTHAIVVTENKKLLEVSILPCFNNPDDWNTGAVTSDTTPESLVLMPKGGRDNDGESTKLSIDIDKEDFASCQWPTPCANDSGDTQPHQLCWENGVVDHRD
ncbi:hypothetical protein MHU86_10324 [Fragilaria crotonensis]|nr:hypothetical protein MHU86_10324 [Fragilaria crotonensis]